ncbi:TPR domain protein [Penicillium lividum]|nr:TPR domain protein [Penicillium lividum]
MRMSPAETLLETKLGRRETDIEKFGMVLEELMFLPLGIILAAAAYINYRGASYSVKQYVDDICNGEFNALTLTGSFQHHLDMRESLLIPCQLSIKYILHTRPSAADVLFLASFFDGQGIPEYLLRDQLENEDFGDMNEVDDHSDTSSFTPSSHTWETCQLLSPHVQKAIAVAPITRYLDDSFAERIALVHNAASFAYQRGNISAAQQVA